MLKFYSTIFVILSSFALWADETKPATLMQGMGSYHHKITTSSEQAQKFFDQGLTLAYAFNHAEAERSFREAARLDPNCTMCYWGISLVLGPNINMQMDKDAVPPAYVALQKAQELMKNSSSQKEQDYVKALATRYGPSPVEDRTKLNEAYANAMRDLAKKYPDDLDAATLFAEALMDIHPWDYYKKDTREPQPWTPEILSTLESVMKRDPKHPGANHFYIHAVEASNHPDKGLPMAERLNTLVPAAGHLVHMPAHIYIRTGDYKKASEANEVAIKSDNAYLSGSHAPGAYSMVYVPHNHHFLSAAATLEGRSKVALDSANAVQTRVDPQMMRQEGMVVLQHFYMVPTFVMVRFGKWNDILASKAPDKDLIYPTAIWHYARGLALVRTGKINDAKKELEQVTAIAANPALEKMLLMDLHKTTDLTQIEVEHLAGEIAAASKDYDTAIKHLQKAVQIEDNLTYDEPPVWSNPMRHYLGAVLLDAKRPADAEKVYREELTKFPKNGWSLVGLQQSLIAQNKTEEAASIKKELDVCWAAADIKLTSSRF